MYVDFSTVPVGKSIRAFCKAVSPPHRSLATCRSTCIVRAECRLVTSRPHRRHRAIASQSVRVFLYIIGPDFTKIKVFSSLRQTKQSCAWLLSQHSSISQLTPPPTMVLGRKRARCECHASARVHRSAKEMER